jgi:EpsI family protein
LLAGRDPMKKNQINSILATLAILVTAVCADVFIPRTLMASADPSLNLELMIPQSFGNWKYRPTSGLVTPTVPESVETTEQKNSDLAAKIYSQEIGRSYVDGEGHTVMLLIAYGPEQNYRLKAHRPEVCYTAQGFRVWDKTEHGLSLNDHTAPLKFSRLITQRETRFEPVSYWLRVGNDVSTGIFDNQLLRFKYGLKGLIPDGALIRVSTIGIPAPQSFELQDKFIKDLLTSITPAAQRFLIGRTLSGTPT